jgi:hypothetical protein
MRETVEVGTPAFAARARRERPASNRAPLTSAEADVVTRGSIYATGHPGQPALWHRGRQSAVGG